MSIYLGGKKAKLFRGDYAPAQIYKGDVKIAGYDVVQKQGTAIECMDTYNDALNPTIEGKSEQTVTVQGKNLFDKQNATAGLPTPTSWFHLKRGKYVVSIKQPSAQNWRFEFSIQKDGIAPEDGEQALGVHLKMYYPGRTQQTGYSYLSSGYRRYIWGSNTTWTYQTIETDDDYDVSFGSFGANTFEEVQFEVAKDIIQLPTSYEPYIPNSPSPDYPAPIRSSENFDVVGCGRNLCNNGEIPVVDSKSYPFKYMDIPSRLKQNTTYTIHTRVKAVAGKLLAVYSDDGFGNFFTVPATGEWQTITRSITTPKAFEHSDVRLSVFDTPYDADSPASFDFGAVYEGAYTAETLPPYEPYHATTAHVIDPLRSVGDVSDSIEVSGGKVEVVRRCNQYIAEGRMRAEFLQLYTSPECAAFAIGDIQGSKHARIGLSTHLPKFSYEILISQITTEECSFLGGNAPSFTNMYFKLKKLRFPGWQESWTNVQKEEALNQWLVLQKTAGTPVITQYILYQPTRTDITATPLGQALLALRTQPHYTQVYTNATLPPTIRASLKMLTQ